MADNSLQLCHVMKYRKALDHVNSRFCTALQLMVPCKLSLKLCHMGIPVISDYVCKGSFAYCLATQVRSGGMV